MLIHICDKGLEYGGGNRDAVDFEGSWEASLIKGHLNKPGDHMTEYEF